MLAALVGRADLEYISYGFCGFGRRLRWLGSGAVVMVCFGMLGVVGLLSRGGLRGLCRVGLLRSIMSVFGLFLMGIGSACSGIVCVGHGRLSVGRLKTCLADGLVKMLRCSWRVLWKACSVREMGG